MKHLSLATVLTALLAGCGGGPPPASPLDVLWAREVPSRLSNPHNEIAALPNGNLVVAGERLVIFSATGEPIRDDPLVYPLERYANDVIVGASGDIYVLGPLPAGATATLGSVPSATWEDSFVSRYTPIGTLEWTRMIRGDSFAGRLAAAADGGVVVRFIHRDSVVLSADTSAACSVPGRETVIAWYTATGELGALHLLSSRMVGALATHSGGDIFAIEPDFSLVRFTPSGASRVPIPTHRSGNGGPERLLALPGGGVVIGGHFWESFGLDAMSVTSTGEPDQEIFLACLDATGTAQWLVRAGGGMLDSIDDLAFLPDGSILAVGTCAYPLGPISFRPRWFRYRGWGSDTLEWTAERRARANAAPVFGAGEPGETTLPHGERATMFVACYRNDGTLRWAEAILCDEYSNGSGVAAWPDGSFAVCGVASGPVYRIKPDGKREEIFRPSTSPAGFVIRYASP